LESLNSFTNLFNTIYTREFGIGGLNMALKRIKGSYFK